MNIEHAKAILEALEERFEEQNNMDARAKPLGDGVTLRDHISAALQGLSLEWSREDAMQRAQKQEVARG